MAVHNFNAIGFAILPLKAHPPLLVDPDAGPPRALAWQGLEMIPQDCSQIRQSTCSAQLVEFALRRACNPGELRGDLAFDEPRRLLRAERADHAIVIFRPALNGKRQTTAIEDGRAVRPEYPAEFEAGGIS